MSAGRSQALGLVLLALATAGVAGAQPRPLPARPPAGRVELLVEPEAPLVAGGRGSLRVQVRLVAAAGWEPTGAGPLLVTVRAEGDALEVVRPRLSRPDAAADDAGVPVLRFPVVARVAGTAVVRVSASAFVCRARRCRAISGQATLTVAVAAPAARRAPSER